ncbi:LlaJI family restriction endonuclease [Longibaculum muris]|uniref:LlaJI family restriction endonuclease n=1 Tax=Longibaculum muris TaxID=1796628 RepID=UPI003AB19E4A
MKINDDAVELYLPTLLSVADYKKNKYKFQQDILSFLKTITLSKTLEDQWINKDQKSYKHSKWPLDSYLWILEDYLKNGVYQNFIKKNCQDLKGKIDWKKTLKTQPIISNGNVIYDKIVTTKLLKSENLITEIYKWIINLSSERIGWIFDYNFHLECNLLFDKNYFLTVLQKEKNNTFEDIKKLRLQMMINVISEFQDNEKKGNKQVYGVTNYYQVFEKMIDIFLGNIIEKNEFYPKGCWCLNDIFYNARSLRPDTIRKENDIIYVIDAKMYKYCIDKKTYNLPSTQSIQKQITYGDYIKKHYPNSSIINLFIIPNHIPKEKEPIEYVGYAIGDWRNTDNLFLHDYIFTFSIDLNYLMHNYTGDNKYIIKKLKELIKDNCKMLGYTLDN